MCEEEGSTSELAGEREGSSGAFFSFFVFQVAFSKNKNPTAAGTRERRTDS
jgi:hypothetical protein